jgi:hypothetical protein
MTILELYLKSVRSYLPEEQRDDIIKELSENIRSQVEDKEAELGRPLTDPEMQAILKQHGHPLLVAGRYRQDHRSLSFGRQLIGPDLFPFYAKVLKFNLGITSVVLLVIFSALFASRQSVTISGMFTALLYQTLIQFATVTLIFSLLDKQFAKFPEKWNPHDPNYPYNVNLKFLKESKSVPRLESISQLIALAISLVWLRAIQESPFYVLGPAAAFLKFSPVWGHYYLPVVAIALLGMAQAGINLVRPDWVRVRSVARVIMSAAMFVIWILLMRSGNWIVPVETAGHAAEGYLRSVAIINQCFLYSLLLAVAISAFQLFRDTRRLFRQTPNSHATTSPS